MKKLPLLMSFIFAALPGSVFAASLQQAPVRKPQPPAKLPPPRPEPAAILPPRVEEAQKSDPNPDRDPSP